MNAIWSVFSPLCTTFHHFCAIIIKHFEFFRNRLLKIFLFFYQFFLFFSAFFITSHNFQCFFDVSFSFFTLFYNSFNNWVYDVAKIGILTQKKRRITILRFYNFFVFSSTALRYMRRGGRRSSRRGDS